jgi:hypothetical protein
MAVAAGAAAALVPGPHTYMATGRLPFAAVGHPGAWLDQCSFLDPDSPACPNPPELLEVLSGRMPPWSCGWLCPRWAVFVSSSAEARALRRTCLRLPALETPASRPHKRCSVSDRAIPSTLNFYIYIELCPPTCKLRSQPAPSCTHSSTLLISIATSKVRTCCMSPQHHAAVHIRVYLLAGPAHRL